MLGGALLNKSLHLIAVKLFSFSRQKQEGGPATKLAISDHLLLDQNLSKAQFNGLIKFFFEKIISISYSHSPRLIFRKVISKLIQY